MNYEDRFDEGYTPPQPTKRVQHEREAALFFADRNDEPSLEAILAAWTYEGRRAS